MDNMSKLLDQLGPDIRRPTKDQVNDMVRRRTKAGAITEGIPLSKRKKKTKPPSSSPGKARKTGKKKKMGEYR
tara:strand:- start:285 stop:503 length:219 start_codon:yes stop_codon:yes gene_type:complete